MPSYQIERTIRIDTSESSVLPAVSDFNQWPRWSPWLCMEPDAKLTYQGQPGEIGHAYQWEGAMVGAGGMEIMAVNDGRYEMELTFLKPFKSKANVAIHVTSAGENITNVSWSMEGKLPFFMFFMLKTMKAMIGADYERGLKMLKEYAETGSVGSKVEVVGVVETDPFYFAGITASSSLSQIGKDIDGLMQASMKLVEDEGLSPSGPPGVIYHDMDFVNQKCNYTLMNQVNSVDGMKSGNSGFVPKVRAIKVVHTGSYAHLGNGWSAAMSYLRYHKLRLNKKQDAFEIYMNDPAETPSGQLVTEIFVPLK